MCNTDKYGFPKAHRQNKKIHYGFQTGDIIAANILRGKYRGIWKGRVACRTNGYFDIKDSRGERFCQGISYKYCRVLQRVEGWQYEKIKLA